MNHQPFQHTSPIQRSAIPENQLQQTSQNHPPSPHQIAPHRFSSSAASPSLPQVSCSMMPLQSSTCLQSPHTTRPSTLQHHTQYTQITHRSLEPSASESKIPTNHPWQIVKKRKRTHLPAEMATRAHPSPFNSPNQFDELSHLSDDDIQLPVSDPHTTTSSEPTTQLHVHKLPPIYVYSVTNYRDMVKYLTETLEEEQYYCKALPNEMVKINVNTSESYRRLIKRLQDDKIVHHTYQIREERA